MNLSDVVNAMEAIAPTRFAPEWDNVGLLVGDPQQDVRMGMLTIDYTAEVAAEAKAAGCDLIVTYHPPIFSPIKRLTAPGLIFDAILRGVAIYSPHTAWDVAGGGTNDFLMDLLGANQRTALRPGEQKEKQFKLVTFVPSAHVEAVANALFEAGAGRIGQYSQCSFRTAGTGTFFGAAETKPAAGSTGKLEKVDEIRLETIVSNDAVEDVVRALRKTHPYEVAAFDLNVLASAAEGVGQGRFAVIAPAARQELLDRIKKGLGLAHLLVAGPIDGEATRIACCAGACGDLLDDAIARKVDVYLTGEMRHHDALRAAAGGMTVACTLHSNSERASLARLRDRLLEQLPRLTLHLSQSDRDPFSVR
jgi:dinuclear metal center YbgI/SA1388 family protein